MVVTRCPVQTIGLKRTRLNKLRVVSSDGRSLVLLEKGSTVVFSVCLSLSYSFIYQGIDVGYVVEI